MFMEKYKTVFEEIQKRVYKNRLRINKLVKEKLLKRKTKGIVNKKQSKSKAINDI